MVEICFEKYPPKVLGYLFYMEKNEFLSVLKRKNICFEMDSNDIKTHCIYLNYVKIVISFAKISGEILTSKCQNTVSVKPPVQKMTFRNIQFQASELGGFRILFLN